MIVGVYCSEMTRGVPKLFAACPGYLAHLVRQTKAVVTYLSRLHGRPLTILHPPFSVPSNLRNPHCQRQAFAHFQRAIRTCRFVIHVHWPIDLDICLPSQWDQACHLAIVKAKNEMPDALACLASCSHSKTLQVVWSLLGDVGDGDEQAGCLSYLDCFPSHSTRDIENLRFCPL